jgi:pilus assembly protein Flp/PilA
MPMKALSIVGRPRSGTMTVQQALNRHPRIASAGAVRALTVPSQTSGEGASPVSQFLTAVKKFVTRREEGASLVEYGLLLALIAVICITAIALLGSNISTMFSNLAGSI